MNPLSTSVYTFVPDSKFIYMFYVLKNHKTPELSDTAA